MSKERKGKRPSEGRGRPAGQRRRGRNKSPDEKQRQSDDIERAVYDGMQDLRAERDKNG